MPVPSVRPATRAEALHNPHDVALRPSRIPVSVQRAGVAAFVAVAAASAVFALTDHWRRATLSLGVAMLWLAVVRLVCDSRIVGVFAVRSRRFDALFAAATGFAMSFLALSVDSLGS